MAQFARPMADTFNEGWQNQIGNSVNIYQAVDEAVQDNADYVQSDLNPDGQVLVFQLSGVVDPGINTGHWFRIAGGKDQAGGRIIDVTVQLRQGYTNEASPGTLIGEQGFLDITAGFSVFEAEILDTSIANITDYDDLFLRIIATTRP